MLWCAYPSRFWGCCWLSNSAQAQLESATLEGYVYDESGAVLPGVTILVTNTDNGSERTVFTNAEGFYTARSLLPGNYSVTATLEGMQTVLREAIVLLVGQRIDISISMDLGVTADIITVTGETPLIEVSRSTPASYLTEVEIENVPIVGRDFKQFALLNPTVTDDPQRGFVTISGQRGIYSGMRIDGASGKNAFFGYANGGEATENDGLVVAQESVKEFQVIQNGYAAGVRSRRRWVHQRHHQIRLQQLPRQRLLLLYRRGTGGGHTRHPPGQVQ